MDNFKAYFCSTIKIEIDEDDKFVLIVFEQVINGEKSMIANVYTGYNHYGILYFQFGLPCNHGDEMDIYEMVIGNIMNDNVTWESCEDNTTIITRADVQTAEEIMVEHGMSEDKAKEALQQIGNNTFNLELYPDGDDNLVAAYKILE